MNRRDFLHGSTALGLVGLAGCTDAFETRSAGSGQFTTVADRGEKVYFPGHTDGMKMLGMAASGRHKVGLSYSEPHPFWTITGTDTNLAKVSDDVTAHLMATVWDRETETVLPSANVSVELSKGGETVDTRSLWPMLSQNMGPHFGDNVELDGDGTYVATLEIGPTQARGMGALQGAFDERTSLEVEFEHTSEKLSSVSTENYPDKRGDAGAIEPMDMKMPVAQVPERGDLPAVAAAATSGDADFVPFRPDESPHFVSEGETYLAVSPRTPHNRYPLPFASLSATLTRDEETVYDDALRPALDPEFGFHYGAAVGSAKSGDEVSLSVDAPPQVVRHEGYETAFVEMTTMELTV